jgi:hypothetical protein
MFLECKARPARKADNLAYVCEPLSRQCGILDISQTYRTPRLITGIASLFFPSEDGIIDQFVGEVLSGLGLT